MPLAAIAFFAGVLPLLAVHLTYLLAAHTGYVEWCIPYLDGCTSISKTGRNPPASYVFRAMILPSAVLMSAYWLLAYQWLLALGDKPTLSNRLLPWLGLIAGVFLIVYATVLGSEGQFYQLMRRHGIIFFFAFTFFAQLLLTYRLARLLKQQPLPFASWIYPTKLGLCLSQISIGLINIPASELGSDELKDVIEWNFALIMISYFFISGIAWWQSAFKANFSTVHDKPN